MKSHSLRKQTIYVLSGKIISFIFQFLTPIILVRIFTSDEYGLYQKILTIALLIIPFLNFSLTNSLYYFFSKSSTKNNDFFISQTFYIPLFISSCLLFCFIIFSPLLLNYFSLEHIEINLIYGTALLIYFASNSLILDHIFIIEGKANYSLVYFSFDKIIRLILILSFVIIFNQVFYAIISILIYYFIKFILLIFYLFKTYNISLKNIDKQFLKSQIIYAGPLFISEIIGKIGSSADRLLLIFLLSSAEFAIYSIGSFRIPMITILYTSVGDTLMPKLSEFSKNNSILGAHSLWKKMIRYNSMFTIPTVLYFIIVAPEFITFLFTDQYFDSILIFQLTLSTFLIQMLGHGYILRAFAKTGQILKANLIRTIISLILGYFLIINLGIIGAALIYIISFNINAFIQLYKSKTVLDVSTREFLPWKDFINFILYSSIAILPVILLKNFEMNSLLYLFISFILFSLTIFYFLLINKYITIIKIKTLLDKLFR